MVIIAIKGGGRPTWLLPHAKMLLIPIQQDKLIFIEILSFSLVTETIGFFSHTNSYILNVTQQCRCSPMLIFRAWATCVITFVCCSSFPFLLFFVVFVTWKEVSDHWRWKSRSLRTCIDLHWFLRIWPFLLLPGRTCRTGRSFGLSVC